MSDGKNEDGTPPPDDQRTVFIPKQADPEPPKDEETPPAEQDEQESWGPAPADENAAPDAPEESGEVDWGAPPAEPQGGGDDDRTRYEPQPPGGGQEWSAPEEPPPAEPAMPSPTSIGATPIAPRNNAEGIKVGDVLNHIFEVKRFIARGGMGEVFEGCNVNSDEKVAIKVMLPSLAADANVINMFRREARTLTRLQHEALVQYRVLAQEPQLGVLYIVTEFIDGVSLSDVLGQLSPTPADLESILRRLASGLRAAHALGLLHRDISPDNVLLDGGKLAGAKIIDFGIAKDLDPGSATIIGDGFAGKLNYVAPEQLGDFGREMGPWTDVYSLGLVILAVAMGRDTQMGGSLVDAVDKRRAGPDLSPIPDSLRPVLEKMLAANPADRLRSMDEVLQALDEAGGGRRAGDGDGGGESKTGLAAVPKPALIGSAATLAILLAGGIWMMSSGGDEPAPGAAGGAPRAAASDPVQAARQAIDAVIPSVNCSWLDIAEVNQESGQVSVAMGGVAGSPSAAQNEIASALSAAGLPNANIDFALVATISTAGCAAIDSYRQIRNTEAPRLSTEQRLWEMRMQEPGTEYAGKEAANVVARMTIGDPNLDVTLFGIDPAGILYPMVENRAHLAQIAGDAPPIIAQGNDSYTVNIDMDHQGWTGLVLITGEGPFPVDIVQPPLGTRNTAWLQQFVQTAARQGWKAEMTWFRSVNQRPGD